MRHFLHLLLTPIGFLLGLFCVLTAIVLYPGEEGKIQSRFEDFWVRVDDYQKLALSKHAAFLTQIAKIETDFLDFLFGHELFSVRAFGMSYCCSLAPISLIFILLFFPVPRPQNEDIYYDCLFSATLLLSSFASGAISILLRNNRFRLSLSLAILYALMISLGGILVAHEEGAYSFLFFRPEPSIFGMTYPMAVLVSFVCDVAFIAATRSLIRWAGKMTSSFKVILTIVMDFLLAVFLLSPPLAVLLAAFLLPDNSHLGDWLLNVALTTAALNVFDVVFASLFVLLALTLLIHRALWPILTRTVFRIQDIGTKGRRGILMTVGLALLGWSGAGLAKELLNALGR